MDVQQREKDIPLGKIEAIDTIWDIAVFRGIDLHSRNR